MFSQCRVLISERANVTKTPKEEKRNKKRNLSLLDLFSYPVPFFPYSLGKSLRYIVALGYFLNLSIRLYRENKKYFPD